MQEWEVDLADVAVCAPFNKVGFQMNPSRVACEEALRSINAGNIIAMSVLASGYLQPIEAIDYVRRLPNISSIVAGSSNVEQAEETFRLLSRSFARNLG